MAKKLSKSEKLDLILAEISKLKGEVRKLTERSEVLKTSKKPTQARAKKGPAKAKTASAPAAKSGSAPKRPVLVAAPAPAPASARPGTT
jgi:hypothetical protein